MRLGIGSSRTGVRVFERPAVDDPRQLANAIRFRAYETLPIPIEEAMLDYHVVEETHMPDRVLLAVAYRDLVDRFAATCAAAKIELVGIDIEAFALLRAVGGEPLAAGERAEAARVAVSIGHDRTTVAVSDGRLCEFTRVLDWGGARVTAAIERALEVDTAEAEQFKRSLDLSSQMPEEPVDERTTRATEAARREVNGLARELASSLHFYQDQPDSLGFAEITITGGGAHLKGLAEQLEELIGISVRVADPFARVGSGKRRRLQRPGRRPRRRNRTGNRGLMRAVNLLPRQQVERTRERPNAVILVASIGGAAVVLALVAGFLLANRSVDRQRQNLSTRTRVLAVTPAHHLSAGTQSFRSTVLNDREQRSLALDVGTRQAGRMGSHPPPFRARPPRRRLAHEPQGSVPLDSVTRGRGRRDDPERAAAHGRPR